MKTFLLATAALLAVHVCTARADEITLIAPGGIRAPIQKMIPDFERKTGHTVKATFGSGNGTKKQVMSGEAFDVPIVQPPLAEVIATGHVIPETETPLATVAVALAVRKGAPKPDISTPDALKKTCSPRRALLSPTARAAPRPA
jgi:molybdate transport system substrate-binding protein